MAGNNKDAQSNKYQLTINNPLEKDLSHEKIKEILLTKFKTLEYACMADEIGLNEKTSHTHIFIYFNSRVRFSTVKKAFPTAHIEQSRGSIEQNIAYVEKSGKWENDIKHGTKIDGTFEEIGNRPKSENHGKNADMAELYDLVKLGWTNSQILEYNNDYILYMERTERLRTILLTEKYKGTRRLDLVVTYIYGVTGSGKTRSVMDEYGDSDVYRVTDYRHPFDSYNCQPVLVFDEFRSSLMIKDMLNYLDIYPIELPARYSNKYACYNKIFIISNWCLEKQYADLQQDDEESWNAFLRRIHKVKVFYDDKVVTYNSVAEYIRRDVDFRPIDGTENNPFEQQKLDFKGGKE